MQNDKREVSPSSRPLSTSSLRVGSLEPLPAVSGWKVLPCEATAQTTAPTNVLYNGPSRREQMFPRRGISPAPVSLQPLHLHASTETCRFFLPSLFHQRTLKTEWQTVRGAVRAVFKLCVNLGNEESWKGRYS